MNLWLWHNKLFREIHLHTCKNKSLAKQLNERDVNLVFDIGAFLGESASALLRGGYNGRVVSFEPQKKYYNKLKAYSRHFSQWDIHDRCALGDLEGEANLNLAANGACSSLLPMLDSHIEAAPHSYYYGTEKVRVRRLDAEAQSYLSDGDSIFLKIDVQGAEKQVLQGSENILHRVKGIKIETSFIPLYDGEMLFDNMKEFLCGQGFVLHDFIPGLRNPKNGRLLQGDMILFRE